MSRRYGGVTLTPSDLLRQANDLRERGSRQIRQDGHGDVHHDDGRFAADLEAVTNSARDIHGVALTKGSFLLADDHSPSAHEYYAELGERVIVSFEPTTGFQPVEDDRASVPLDHRPESNPVREGNPSGGPFVPNAGRLSLHGLPTRRKRIMPAFDFPPPVHRHD